MSHLTRFTIAVGELTWLDSCSTPSFQVNSYAISSEPVQFQVNPYAISSEPICNFKGTGAISNEFQVTMVHIPDSDYIPYQLLVQAAPKIWWIRPDESDTEFELSLLYRL